MNNSFSDTTPFTSVCNTVKHFFVRKGILLCFIFLLSFSFNSNVNAQCPGSPLNVTITATTIDACVGHNPPPINTTVSGGSGTYTYQWYYNGSPITDSTRDALDLQQFIASGSYSYYVVVTDNCLPANTATSATKVFNIFLDPSVSISGSGSVCLNSINLISATVIDGTGTMQYQWQSSTTNTTGSWVDIGSLTASSTYVPPTAALGTKYYRVILTPNIFSCNDAQSNVISVTVNPLPTAFSVNGGGSYCAGGSGVVITLNGSQSGVSYQLQIGGVNTGSPFAGTGGAISLGSQTAAGTYTVVATNTTTLCTSTMNGSAVVTINPLPTISISPATATICNGQSISLIASGATTYSWSPSTGLSSTAGSTVTANPTSTITYTITGTDDNDCINTTSRTVTVNQLPTVAASTANPIICSGTASTINISNPNNISGTTFTWTATIQTPPSGGTISGFSDCSSACGTSINHTLINTGTTAGVVRYNITATANGCSGTPTTIDVTVNPVPIANAGPDQTGFSTCGLTTVTLAANNPTAGTGSWSIVSGTGESFGNSSSNTSTFSGVAGNSYQLRWTVSNPPCTQSTDDVLVTFNTLPVITTNTPLDTGVCRNNNLTLIAAASGTPSPTVQWQIMPKNSSTWSDIGGETNPSLTLINVGSNDNGNRYRAIFTNICGTATTNVTLLEVGAPINPDDIPSQTITGCSSFGTVTFTSSANGGNGLVVMIWQVSTNGGTNWTNIDSTLTTSTIGNFSTSYTFTPTVAMNGYKYRVQYSNGGCDASWSNAATLSVLPSPTVSINGVGSQTVCNGSNSTQVNFTGANATAFNWKNNNSSIGLAASGTASIATPFIAPFTAVNNGTTPVIATITVIAVNTSGSTTCLGDSTTFTITVNPSVTVNAGANQIICQSATPSAITLTGASVTGGTTTGTWSITSGTGSLSNTNPTTTPGTVTFTPGANFSGTVILTLTSNDPDGAGPCVAASATKTITINAAATANAGGPDDVCQTSSPSAITLSGSIVGGGATTGAWSIISGGGSLSGTSQVLNPSTITYTPASNFSGTVTLRLMTNFLTGCNAATSDRIITVNPLPLAPTPGDTTLCGPGPVNLNASDCTGTLKWYSAASGGTLLFTGSPYSIALVNTTTTYYVSCTSPEGCEGPRAPLVVTIRPVIVGSIASDQSICSGGDPAAFTSVADASTNATLSLQWQSSTDGGSTWNNISGAVFQTYNPPAGITVTTLYRRVATGTKNTGPSSGRFTCSVNSNTVTVTVNNVSAGTVGSNQTICSGGDPDAFSVTTAATGAGALSYQWQSNTTGCSGPWTNISGATSSTYDIPSGLTTTTYYQLVVTSTLNGVPCSAPTNCITVTVNPLPAIIPAATATSVCFSTSAQTSSLTYSNPTNTPTTYSIVWSAVAITAGFVNVTDAALPASPISIAVPANAPVGTYQGTITVKNANGCVSLSSDFNITINPKPLPIIISHN